MKHTITLLAALCLGISVKAQYTFESYIGQGPRHDNTFNLWLKKDGGFLMNGYSQLASDENFYIVNANSNGDTIWTRLIGGPQDELGYEIRECHDGHVAAFGWTQSYGNGSTDYYLVKLDSTTGDTLWTKTYGTAGSDEGHGFTVTGDSSFLMIGSALASGPDPDGWDMFIIKADKNGDTLWTKNIGGPNSDGGFVIAGSTVDFGSFISGSRIIRTNSTGDTLWTHMYPGMATSFGRGCVQAGLSDYVFAGSTADFFVNANLDYYLTKLNKCTQTFSQTSVSTCGDYFWNSNTYTVSGTYTDTIPNTAGCDSVMTLNLVINNSTTSTISATACNNYTVPSGDETCTVSGTYLDTIPNSAGCDSVMTLNLTINKADASVTATAGSLTANAAGGTYQWLNCDNNFAPILGASGQTYSPASTGNYAVAITENGCTDTSSCYNVIVTRVESIGVGAVHVNIHPNPTDGTFIIEYEAKTNTLYEIKDIAGKVIEKGVLTTPQMTLDLRDNPAGAYIIDLYSNKQVIYSQKIIKE